MKTLYKVIIQGNEYFVTDKAAHAILDIVQADMEQIKKDIEDLKDKTNWKILR